MRTKKIIAFCFLSLAFIFSSCGGKIERHGGVDTPDAEKKLDHLVILEVFYLGSWQDGYTQKYTDPSTGETHVSEVPGAKYQTNDTYIKLYNPTNETKYLDGLALVTSEIVTTLPFSFKEPEQDFTKDFLGVDQISMFPGNGKDHPIKPGQTILIVASAGNHRAEVVLDEETGEKRPGNPLSFDFSNADWEWLPEGYADGDDFEYLPDNEKVPNMVDIYNEDVQFQNVAGPFTIDPRKTDSRGIALVDLHTDTPNDPEAVKEAITNRDKSKPVYWWPYTAIQVNISNEFEGTQICIALPKAWCIDAVTMSPKSNFRWLAFPKDIDKGAFGANVSHKTQFAYTKEELGLAIRRKHDGLKFVDNDNSSFDFETVPASLSDWQKTAPAAQ